jgi:hypothetical protein
MTNRYWDTFPLKALYSAKYVSKKHLAWHETNSSLKIATAKNEKGGRSRTIRYLHASEVGFWDNAHTLFLGLRQSIPNANGTVIVLESTANGVGNFFYDKWFEAEAGKGEYEPMFFPWQDYDAYRASAQGLPIYRLSHLDEEERVLARLGVDSDQLIWRRWAIHDLAGGDILKFHQEYPSTPEEAFISTGMNVFPTKKLVACYHPLNGIKGHLNRDTGNRRGVRFQPDDEGPLTVFSYPSTHHDFVYFVGGDPTGTTRGDFACIQVINRRTYEQVAVWRGRIEPGSFARELAKLGAYYNNAMISTEATGPGYSTIGRLIEMDYPHLWRNRWADKSPGIIASTYGFNSTTKTKEWAIGHLLQLIVDGDLVIHDRDTFAEMRSYVTLEAGGYGPASEEGHDDTVMSLAIGCLCAATEPPLPPVETGPIKDPNNPLYGLPDTVTGREAFDPEFWFTQDLDLIDN